MTLFLYFFFSSCSAAELIRRENKKIDKLCFFICLLFLVEGGKVDASKLGK